MGAAILLIIITSKQKSFLETLRNQKRGRNRFTGTHRLLFFSREKY